MNCEAHMMKREHDGTPRTCGREADFSVADGVSDLKYACDAHIGAVIWQGADVPGWVVRQA